MAAPIASLQVELAASVARLQSDLKKGRREFRNFAKSVQGDTSTIAKGFSLAGSFAKGFVGALSVGAIVSFAKSSLNAAADIGEMAEQLGVSAKNLQVYQFAAEQSGASSEQLEGALMRLTASIGEAEQGNKTAIQAFDRLGIKLLDVDGKARSTDQVFADLADAYKNSGDKAQFAANAKDVMGKSVQRLLPMLADGADGLDTFAKRAQELGLVLSDDFVRQADIAVDQLKTLSEWLEKVSARAVIRFGFTTGLIDPTVEQEISRLREELKNPEQSIMLGGPGPEELQQQLDALLELRKLQASLFTPPATAGAGASNPAIVSGGKGGREKDIELIDAEASSLAQLLDKMREENELLGMSAEQRDMETAMRQAQAAAMEDGNLLNEQEIAQVRQLAAEKHNLTVAEQVYQDQLEAQKSKQQEAIALAQSLSSTLASGISDAIFRGEKLIDTLGGIAESLVEAVIQASIFNLVMAAFGGGAGGAAGGGSGLVGDIIGKLFHEGGIVGSGGSSRRVSAMAFTGAPRLHNGLRSDEFPAILQAGEQVIPRGGSSGDSDIFVTVVNNGNDKVTVGQRTDGKKGLMVMIDQAVADSIRTNGVAARQMQASFGLSRKGVS